MTIKVLHQQGKGIKTIARELGISKNTVRKYLKSPSKPTYSERPKRPSKLDPFKPYLSERIEAASPEWIPASVLFDEIVMLGYTGKIRILRSYLTGQKLKKARIYLTQKRFTIIYKRDCKNTNEKFLRCYY